MLIGPRAIRRAIIEVQTYVQLRGQDDLVNALHFIQFLNESESSHYPNPPYDDVPYLLGSWHLESIERFCSIVGKVLGSCVMDSCSVRIGWRDFGVAQFALNAPVSAISFISLAEIGGHSVLVVSGDQKNAMRINADHDTYDAEPGVYYDIDIFGRKWTELVRAEWQYDKRPPRPVNRRQLD